VTKYCICWWGGSGWQQSRTFETDAEAIVWAIVEGHSDADRATLCVVSFDPGEAIHA